MRGDYELLPLRSRHLYEFVQTTLRVINRGPEDGVYWEDLIELEKAASPNKTTLLHDVIEHSVWEVLEYSTGHYPDPEYYRSILTETGIPIPRWLNERGLEKRTNIIAVGQLLLKATQLYVPSIFHILFSDRRVMTAFQERIASYIGTLVHQEHPSLLNRDGVLKRPKHLPSWLRNGVFNRDHGRCQICYKDLSGLRSAVRDLDYDHIIPLSASGSNDPTNFQLLCSRCNSKKGTRKVNKPPRFAPFW